METFYDVLRRQGITRRSFLKFCSLTATSLGLGSAFAPRTAHALEAKPRTPVLWLHGLECNPPLGNDGMYCISGGKPFIEKLQHVAKDCKAVIAWGSCASWGCVQAAKPNPTQATPIHKVITDKPIVKVPGCPPIAEVMTAVVTYMLTFDRLPELDRQGRPKMFYGQRIHDKCYRRPHFDAGQFVEQWDDEGARKGYCLYKVGCKGPTTYNACSTTRWNEGVSFPIASGHGCIGCSEDGFWDKGSFYDRVTKLTQFGVEANADRIGGTIAAVTAAGVAVHAGVTALKRMRVDHGDGVRKDGTKATSDVEKGA